MLNIDMMVIDSLEFLSSNTQDFIEVATHPTGGERTQDIPEL